MLQDNFAAFTVKARKGFIAVVRVKVRIVISCQSSNESIIIIIRVGIELTCTGAKAIGVDMIASEVGSTFLEIIISATSNQIPLSSSTDWKITIVVI